MNFVKRGLVSIWRKPGKSLTLLVLIFVLGNVIAGAISVKQAIRNTQDAMYDKIGMICRVSVDYEKFYSSYSEAYTGVDDSKNSPEQIASLTSETVDAIGQSQYVKYYDYFTSMWLESTDLQPYVSESGGSVYPVRDEKGGTAYPTSFQFSGGQNPDISDFVQGKATLYQGRLFTAAEMTGDSNVVLISKQFAEKNALSVGSVIKFKRDIYQYIIYNETDDSGAAKKAGDAETGSAAGSSAGSSSTDGKDPIKVEDPKVAKTLEYEFTVIGIFDPVPTTIIGQDGKPQTIDSSLVNVLYTTNKAVNTCNEEIAAAEKEVNGTDAGYYYSMVDPIFVLNKPEDLEPFKAEAAQKLPDYYVVTDNSQDFANVTAPMANMGWIAGIVLYVAIGATLLILSLLVTLFLRDRKHEMGIYLSLGERKVKVAGQILIEVMMIAVIAISMSLFTGNIIAKNISGQMLENQIIAEQQNGGRIDVPVDIKSSYSGYSGYYSNGSLSSMDLINLYKVTLDAQTILLFYACGIGTAMLSTLVPIAYTLRLNPKKILM